MTLALKNGLKIFLAMSVISCLPAYASGQEAAPKISIDVRLNMSSGGEKGVRDAL